MKGPLGGTWPRWRDRYWQRYDHKRARREAVQQIEDLLDEDVADEAEWRSVTQAARVYGQAVGSAEVPEVTPEIASDGAVSGVAPFVPTRLTTDRSMGA